MRNRVNRWTPWLLLVGVAIMLAATRFFDLAARLDDLRGWIESLGSLGPVVFVGLYVIATVAAIPGVALTLSAGVLFGAFWGVVVVSAGSTLGASLAFLVSRYIARDAIAAWIAKNERFTKLDRMTEQQGWIMVLLTRLVPIFPFNLLNYGFGLTRVRFGTYVLFSWIGMLPGTVVYVVGADAVSQSLDGRVPWPLVGLLVVAVMIVALIVRFARRELSAREARAAARSGR